MNSSPGYASVTKHLSDSDITMAAVVARQVAKATPQYDWLAFAKAINAVLATAGPGGTPYIGSNGNPLQLKIFNGTGTYWKQDFRVVINKTWLLVDGGGVVNWNGRRYEFVDDILGGLMWDKKRQTNMLRLCGSRIANVEERLSHETPGSATWRKGQLILNNLKAEENTIRGRFLLEGWAIPKYR
jgi:hypothetical protein